MLQQLLFQGSTGLNEQAAVNGFLGHTHALIIGILGFQPAGNLLGRPVQNQFTRNDVPQLQVDGKKAAFGPQGRQASLSAGLARYAGRPPCRATSRLTVDTARCKHLAISRNDEPEASPREISSRSRSVSARSARRRTAGAIPP